MSPLSQLIETLYVETAADGAMPLVPAGSVLPITCTHSLATARGGQGAIDLHLLRGTSSRASQNATVGRWRISGFPGREGRWPDIAVHVHVDRRGQVSLHATLDRVPLKVLSLGGAPTALPIGSASEHDGDPLVAIRHRVQTGDRDGARRELGRILRADPQNAAAWDLLASLLDDPAQRVDCYRQILRIYPQDRSAAAKLDAALAPQLAAPEPTTLRCESCGGGMKVRYLDGTRDKIAVCLYCGTEIDLPDAYQRVERRHAHERGLWGEQTVESWSENPSVAPPEVQKLLDLVQNQDAGALDDETLAKLRQRGIDVQVDRTVRGSVSIQPQEPGFFTELLRMLGADDPQGLVRIEHRGISITGRKVPTVAEPLTASEIVHLAGDPLPPEERVRCPECGTVVSRTALRCSWCGRSMGAK